jgi:hypothetical protein
MVEASFIVLKSQIIVVIWDVAVSRWVGGFRIFDGP